MATWPTLQEQQLCGTEQQEVNGTTEYPANPQNQKITTNTPKAKYYTTGGDWKKKGKGFPICR